jgi:hypothetical protein
VQANIGGFFYKTAGMEFLKRRLNFGGGEGSKEGLMRVDKG